MRGAVAGSALGFNGTSGYAIVSHNASLNTLPITLTAWVKTSTVDSDYRGIVAKASADQTNGYALALVNGSVAAAYSRTLLRNVLDGANYLDGGFIADGNWHHVGFVVDQTGATGGPLGLAHRSRLSYNRHTSPGGSCHWEDPCHGARKGRLHSVRFALDRLYCCSLLQPAGLGGHRFSC